MQGSYNKHELDIPTLSPDTYFKEFLSVRNYFYSQIPEEVSAPTFASDKNITSSSCSPESINILNALIHAYTSKTFTPDNLLLQIQKKFAVFGRIAEEYSTEFKKISDITDNRDIYSITSVFFFDVFIEHNDYNALNTAIKLIDKACSIDKPGNQLFYYALQTEQCILEDLNVF